jgi:hypothetical protein
MDATTMKSLKIYSDTPFDSSAMGLLKTGTSPHELVFPAKMAGSVLGTSVADRKANEGCRAIPTALARVPELRPKVPRTK